MLDGVVRVEELAMARELDACIPIAERRGVHARVFANVLQEILQDSAVSGNWLTSPAYLGF